MDPMTHTLAGAVMARAGLDERTPLAAATLMLAANAPDIDIFIMFAGQYDGLAFRRGWTHGPSAWLLLPVILTGLVMAWDRWVRLRRDPAKTPIDPAGILLLAVIGVLSHPALDWLNTYGIRLLMPFSDRWFYGDAVFIIDPWIWLALGAALLWPRRTVRRVRIVGGVVVGYVLAMIVMSNVAESIAQRAAVTQGIASVEEVMYAPQPAQPLKGGLIVVTPEEYRLGEFRWIGGERVRLDGRVIARGDWSADVVQRAMLQEDVRDYLTWSRFPFVRHEGATSDGRAVFFGDARFTDGVGGSLEGVRVVVPTGTE
ncbi:MAG TPA: metal-dependent hydrolase [Gemmatimonadaceae bacterium]|nr:metal-dependent hydrolase [Gemmatimonadaceae bacterium]